MKKLTFPDLKMKNINKILLSAAILTLVIVSGCKTTKMDETQKQYLQHGFYIEKNVYLTTNYGAGVCHPVNEVFYGEGIKNKLFGKDYIKVTSEKGQSIAIKNIGDHSNKNIEQVASEMFSTSPVDLSKHSSEVVAAIKNCKIIKGMTRQEVILARGYPPVHATPSIDSNTWQYWEKRFSKGKITFKNGKVVSIEGRVQPK